MFRKMPVFLVIVILFFLCFGNFIPLCVNQLLYAISISIKSIIIFLLPFIIFGLLFKTALQLAEYAAYVIISIFFTVCVSNFISTFLSHYVGMLIYHFDFSIVFTANTRQLTPLWFFELPSIISNDKAMMFGIIIGIIMGVFKLNIGHVIVKILDTSITKILHILTYLIPLFITGFIAKLTFDDTINIIISHYWLIFIIVACAQCMYIAFFYLIVNNFHISEFLRNIKNMFPAAITGFSTMSSAAAMPFTIIGVENNCKNKDIARAVVPATVNIHLVGDCIAIPIFAYAILKSYLVPEPSIVQYSIFTFYFVLAKFSVAAIPGGGIIVMLPILEKHLGFNTDMMSLITTLYVLFDPIITCVNVLGNGAFAKLIDKIKLFKR